MNESASDANKLRKNLFILNTMMNFLTGQEEKIPLANKTDKLTAYEDEDAGPLGLSKLFFSSLPEVSSPGKRRERGVRDGFLSRTLPLLLKVRNA